MICHPEEGNVPEKNGTAPLNALVIMLLCGFAGLFFAFTVETYWTRIQYKEDPLFFPLSTVIFYSFCLIAYIMQGSGFLLLSKHHKKSLYKKAFLVFWGQFILSILWLGLFFGLKLSGLAFFDLFIAFLFLIVCFSFFRAIQMKAAFFLIPAGILIALMGMLNAWFIVV